MQQYIIQAVRDIRIDLLHIEDPVCRNQREVVGIEPCKDFRPQFRIVQDIGGAKIFPAKNEKQDIAKTEKIKGERPFREIKIIVEVNPAKTAIFVIDVDMVAPDISMFEPMGMKKGNPTHGIEKID